MLSNQQARSPFGFIFNKPSLFNPVEVSDMAYFLLMKIMSLNIRMDQFRRAQAHHQYIYIYVCMYVCMYVCTRVCVCMYVCMYVCMCIYIYVCVYICMIINNLVSLYLCMQPFAQTLNCWSHPSLQISLVQKQ